MPQCAAFNCSYRAEKKKNVPHLVRHYAATAFLRLKQWPHKSLNAGRSGFGLRAVTMQLAQTVLVAIDDSPCQSLLVFTLRLEYPVEIVISKIVKIALSSSFSKFSIITTL